MRFTETRGISTFHVVLSSVLVEELGTDCVDFVDGSMGSQGVQSRK